jgi:hypothetical protein
MRLGVDEVGKHLSEVEYQLVGRAQREFEHETDDLAVTLVLAEKGLGAFDGKFSHFDDFTSILASTI